jgi:hypothetical protein
MMFSSIQIHVFYFMGKYNGKLRKLFVILKQKRVGGWMLLIMLMNL